MPGWFDDRNDGWTELRVHGVSGTPPENMLEAPQVARVSGDDLAGFYRRRWESPPDLTDNGKKRLEAYSWGGLTSAAGSRALWLLLLPFMLINVAYFAAPWAQNPSEERDRPHWINEAVQRILAFTLTLTMVLAAVVVFMDLIGWQCGNHRLNKTSSCARFSWMGSWVFDTPGRHLALAALGPLALVALIWWLGRKTWESTETTYVPKAPSDDIGGPLEDRALWNGRKPVAELRKLHISGAMALIGVFLLTPHLRRPGDGLPAVFDPDQFSSLLGALFAALLILCLLVLVLVIVFLPKVKHRPTPGSYEAGLDPGHRWLPWIALGLLIAAMVLVSVPGQGSGDAAKPATQGLLPWMALIGEGVIAIQAVLLLILVPICWWLARQRPRPPQPPKRPAKPDVAWWGLGTAAIAMLGWMIALAFAAGVTWWAAAYLGTPRVPGTDADDGAELTIPTEYIWIAAASGVLLAIVLGLVAYSVTKVRLERDKTLIEQVNPIYDKDEPTKEGRNKKRATSIAKTWTTAEALAGRGELALSIFLVLAAFVGLLAFAGRIFVGTKLFEDWRWLIVVGNIVITGFVVGLLYVGRQAYKKPQFRRGIGVLWDIGTFWPRATHPLAPPCYAERTIPDLLDRIDYLILYNQSEDPTKAPGTLLLSCHSQGTVIGAAVLVQTREECTKHVAFLTYGAPLRRLYGRMFPAYFNEEALRRLGRYLSDAKPPADRTDSSTWRWRNLYRRSDPIGGYIFTAEPLIPPEQELHDVDLQLRDPMFAKQPGDNSWPITHGHSDYWLDKAFTTTTDDLYDRLNPKPASAAAGSPAESGSEPLPSSQEPITTSSGGSGSIS